MKDKYEYINFSKTSFPPYSLDSKVYDIKSKEEWDIASQEISDFLETGEVLQRGGKYIGKHIFKKDARYIVTDDLVSEDPHYWDKLRNKDNLEIMTAKDIGEPNLEDKLSVLNIYDDIEGVLNNIRQAYELGYETRIIDTWNNRKHIAVVDGIHMG